MADGLEVLWQQHNALRDDFAEHKVKHADLRGKVLLIEKEGVNLKEMLTENREVRDKQHRETLGRIGELATVVSTLKTDKDQRDGAGKFWQLTSGVLALVLTAIGIYIAFR